MANPTGGTVFGTPAGNSPQTRLMRFFVVSLLAVATAAAQDTSQDKEAAALAKFQAAAAKMMEAGALAQQGKFGPANELMAAAADEIDAAVESVPGSLKLRAQRGVMYGSFPPFLGKAEIARKDLDLVHAHPQYSSLKPEIREKVEQLLKPVSGPADRFPGISADLSPLIAAASITWPAGAGPGMPKSMTTILSQLDGYPGLIARHVVASVDHPGMYIIFTWWRNKKDLNAWFYGDLHQRWMRQRGDAMNQKVAVLDAEMPSQVAMEVFAGMPGGIQINGGFVPKAALGAADEK